VIGGMSQDLVLRNCWELDGNMNMISKEPMKVGRFNSALSLLSDRYIFAIGGFVAKDKATDSVEIYDTKLNQWNPVASLNKPRASTSACTVANRYIYVFPG
jgi:Kelch motif